MSLAEAVERNLIARTSVTVLDPNTSLKVDLGEALESGIMDGKTGDVINSKTSE